jgi:hypothetical protein
MPAAIDESIKRKVIQQWVSGFPRDKIATENNIGPGTVTTIVSNYKVGLEQLEFDYLIQLALEVRKHGLNLSELASHFRLYNYFVKSRTAEDKIGTSSGISYFFVNFCCIFHMSHDSEAHLLIFIATLHDTW